MSTIFSDDELQAQRVPSRSSPPTNSTNYGSSGSAASNFGEQPVDVPLLIEMPPMSDVSSPAPSSRGARKPRRSPAKSPAKSIKSCFKRAKERDDDDAE